MYIYIKYNHKNTNSNIKCFLINKMLFFSKTKYNIYRKRLNNGPTFFHTRISYINRVHACKKSGPLFKPLRYINLPQ